MGSSETRKLAKRGDKNIAQKLERTKKHFSLNMFKTKVGIGWAGQAGGRTHSMTDRELGRWKGWWMDGQTDMGDGEIGRAGEYKDEDVVLQSYDRSQSTSFQTTVNKK